MARNRYWPGRHHSVETKAKLSAAKTGSKHPGWKGGRYTLRGYVRVLVRISGRRRVYEYEHRLVLEEMLERQLLAHETVHHRNGITDDNRPENLELRTGRHGRGATKHCLTCTCHLDVHITTRS